MDFHFLSGPVSFIAPPAPQRFEAECGSAVFFFFSNGLLRLPLWLSSFGVHYGAIIAACDVAVGDAVMADGFSEAMGVKYCGMSGRVALLVFIRFL